MNFKNRFVIFKLLKNLSKKLVLLFSITFILLLISSYLESYVIGSAFPLINSFLTSNETIDIDSSRILYFQKLIFNFIASLIIISITKYITINAIFTLSKRVCADVSKRCLKVFIGINDFLDISELSYKEQLNQCTQDIDKLNIFLNAYLSFMLSIFCSVAIILSLFNISFKLSLISIAFILSAYFFTNILRKRRVEIEAKKQFFSNQNLTEIASYGIQDKKEIQTYEAQYLLLNEFEIQANNKFLAIKKLGLEAGAPRLIIEPIAYMTVLFPLVYFAKNGDFLILREIMATTSTILFGLVRLIPILQQLFAARVRLNSAVPPVESIISSLNQSKGLFDFKNNNQQNISRELIKNIIFKKITTLDQKNKRIFSAKSFSLSQGESLVITGKSGTGKSSFLETICGLRKQSSGFINIKTVSNDFEICLGGLKRSWAKGLFAYVPQRPYIFDETIEKNLNYFNIDRNDLFFRRVLKLVFIEEIYKNRYMGIKTKVNMNSNSLSGGEMQRIAIARALLSRRPILILDECTSALDSELAESIIKNILDLAKEQKILVLCVNHDPKLNLFFDKNIRF